MNGGGHYGGQDHWPNGSALGLHVDPRGSDMGSETTRGYRSTSRSDPSSEQAGHDKENSPLCPDGRVNGSMDTLPDPSPIIPYWSSKRHLTCGNPAPRSASASKVFPWRGSARGRLRTESAALVLCLNIDVDPPDVIKTNPCAVLEAWVDPHTMPSHKALEAIGLNLRHQFSCLSGKIQYKEVLDPSYEDLSRWCRTLRKTAKDETVLLYYNGHGVPKPTPSGELWCFNRNYTQYIPVSLMEVQAWVGSPAVYVWDCSAAGNLLTNFQQFAERRDHDANMMHGGYPDGQQPFLNSLQLAACAAHEQLPSCPELPADLFTSCLTSPIDIALRYFIITHQLPYNVSNDMVMQLPGDLKDRRTPLGELNWIFTAITDTIAWTTFPRDVFTRLYRSDLLIASLFRNFLLAERILKNYHCTPHTYPSLPPTNTHPLWASWDLAVDTCIRQLPELLKDENGEKKSDMGSSSSLQTKRRMAYHDRDRATQQGGANVTKSSGQPDNGYKYIPSRFFTDQLTAFEVWISRGGSALTKRGPLSLPTQAGGERDASMDGIPPEDLQEGQNHDPQDQHLVPRKPPDQLPIVLQVLLSQPHRLRALILLSQFVDLGPWAVHLVLTIGIFPYISKLLSAAGPDLRPVLIFIWARILAVDPSVQMDLFNTKGYQYFSKVLALREGPPTSILPNISEHKAMCAFILAAIARDFPLGQTACWQERVFDNAFERLNDDDFLLRQWCALCLGQIWDGNDEIKVYGVDRGAQDKLIALLSDDACEVRTAALFALGTFMGASGSADAQKHGGRGSGTMFQLEERIHFRMEVAVITGATLAVKDDASPMVRKELLVVISCLVKEWRGYFVVCAWMYWEEDRKWKSGALLQQEDDITSQAVAEWLDGFGDDDALREENRVLLSSFFTIFTALLELSVDPYLEASTNAQTIVDYIMALLLESPFTRLDSTTLNTPPTLSTDRGHVSGGHRSRVASLSSSPSLSEASPVTTTRPNFNRSETMSSTISSGVSNTLRRTASFANTLKSLAGSISFPSLEDGRSTPSPTAHAAAADLSRAPSPNLNLAQYTSPYSRPATPEGGPSFGTAPPRAAMEGVPQPPMDFLPSDVMEALMEEDMERLRARRRASSHARRSHHGNGAGSLPSPVGSTFSVDSNGSSVILGLGTGAGIRDVLPLKSAFFDWCTEYFKEPQMRQTEADEPGSVEYNYQVWRQQRNDHIMRETFQQTDVAQDRSWDRPVATLHVPGQPLTMAFHSFDQHLVVANETDMVGVWDWSSRRRLNYFCNGNPRGSMITSLHIINQDVGGMIMTGSADGVVRLFRNYDSSVSQDAVQMVSAFRGLNEVVQMRRGAGVVMDWKQSGGTLFVGGDSRAIRVWDAHTESQQMDLETASESPVTALCADAGGSPTLLASFADGEVKLFDRRLEEEDAVAHAFTAHASRGAGVRWHPTRDAQFLSAGGDGEVKLWDLRKPERAAWTWDAQPGGLGGFDVHGQAAVFATTSALTPAHFRYQRVAVHRISTTAPSFTTVAPPSPIASPYLGFNQHAFPTAPAASTIALPHSPTLPSLGYGGEKQLWLGPGGLSAASVPTGLGAYASGGGGRAGVPHRSPALVFHPMEMLYGMGAPDGTVRIMGCKLS